MNWLVEKWITRGEFLDHWRYKNFDGNKLFHIKCVNCGNTFGNHSNDEFGNNFTSKCPGFEDENLESVVRDMRKERMEEDGKRNSK
jgi:hypothetical protein